MFWLELTEREQKHCSQLAADVVVSVLSRGIYQKSVEEVFYFSNCTSGVEVVEASSCQSELVAFIIHIDTSYPH